MPYVIEPIEWEHVGAHARLTVNHFSNNRGDEFRVTEVSGVEKAYDAGGRFEGSMTYIPPKSAITVLAKSQVRWSGKAGDYRPYRFQTVVVFGEENQGRYPNAKKYNLVLDVK